MATIASIQPISSPQITPIWTPSSQVLLVTWNFLYKVGGLTDLVGDAFDCAGFTKISVGISGTWNGAQIGWITSLAGTYDFAISNITVTGTHAVANDTVAVADPTEKMHTLLQIPRYLKPTTVGTPANDFGVTPYALLYRD